MTPYYKDDSVTIYHAPCEEVIGTVEGADLVLTDAPYNGDIAYGGGVNDSRDWNEYVAWLAGILTKCETTCKGPVMCFVSKPGMIRMSAVKPPLWVGAWISPGGGNPAGNTQGLFWLPYWEPCLVYGNLKAWKCAMPDTWKTAKVGERNGHPCPKPISLMEQIIAKTPAQMVLDCFMGSGTTLVAAKSQGRKAVGIEINEKYCEIAARRCSQEVLSLYGANNARSNTAGIK